MKKRMRAMKKRGEEHEDKGEEEIKEKKTYRERERNSQRDSKWIHVDQVLHHQVCDEILTISKVVQLQFNSRPTCVFLNWCFLL